MTKHDKEISLEERTTINFPHKIIPAEAQDLFTYLVDKLSYMDLRVKYHEEITHNISLLSNHQDEFVHSQEVIKIEGQVMTPHNIVMLPFRLERTVEDQGSRYSALKFWTTPGYDLEEINPSEIELMDKIKLLVTDYFKKNQTQ